MPICGTEIHGKTTGIEPPPSQLGSMYLPTFAVDAFWWSALLQPDLFTTRRAAVDVEIAGELTTGATVFDRRSRPQWTGTLDVAVDVNETGAYDALLTGLERAAAVE